MSTDRRTYDPAFKLNAVQLSYERKNIRELADELGINVNLLYRWRSEYAQKPEASFPGHGKPKLTPEEAEIAKLKKELADVRMEHEILKKAISIFSKNDGRPTGS